MNFPIAVPFTDTRSSRPVETDNVPGFGGGGADEELAAGDVGLVPVAGEDVKAPGEDCKATGVVVTPPGEPDGPSPCPAAPLPALPALLPPLPLLPLRPEGPPRAGPGFSLLTGALCVDPPAGPADGGGCGPTMTPTVMAPATMTNPAAPATTACGSRRIRRHGPAPGGLTGLGKP